MNLDDYGYVGEYFTAWLDSLDEGWWDDAADAGTFEFSLAQAFLAGYDKCLEDHP